jgi:xanthine dehydrogenase accessory factor
MRSLKETISKWKDNENLVVARVINTWGSSPRPVGSALIIDEELNMAGSVSGGCVEGAVLKEAKLLFNSSGSKLLSYGVTDEDAWSVGLSCGGKISVFIQLLKKDAFRDDLFDNILNNIACVWISKIEDAEEAVQFLYSEGNMDGQKNLDSSLMELAKEAMSKRISTTMEHESAKFFFHNLSRKAQMLIIGSAHITADLVHLGKYYDFETIVIDPRSTFASRTQYFDDPDDIITAYPSEVLSNYSMDQYTYAIILSHDPKIDDNALQILLNENVAYIGALGSRKTHAKRIERLKASGLSDEQIGKIAAPIGLNIKAKSPREIALSIMGQIIETKNKFL